MSCPICGANCKCRNRGEGGICCSCHRHKPRKLIVTDAWEITNPEWIEAIEKHRKRNDEAELKEIKEKGLQEALWS